MAGSLAEADKLMKQARKLSSPSMLGLRMRGDWEQATPLFERAGTQYKVQACYHHTCHQLGTCFVFGKNLVPCLPG